MFIIDTKLISLKILTVIFYTACAIFQINYNAQNNFTGDFNCDVQKSPEVNGNQVVCQSVEHNGVKGIYFLVNFNYNLAPEHTGLTFKVHTEDREGNVKECSVENVPVTSKNCIIKCFNMIF